VKVFIVNLECLKWIQKNISTLKTICFVLMSSYTYSQNLVDNPSFEVGQPQCDFTILPYFYSTNVYGWNIPNNSTADVFSTQIPNKACYGSMPDSGMDINQLNPRVGSILPRTGSRFAGIYTYYKNEEYREYIQGRLTTPLVIGQSYCVEMHVAVAGQPRYACNGLGIYFSPEFLDYNPTIGSLPYTPQIVENEIITSTTWVRISGVYKATAASTYFTIGNFKTDNQIRVIDKGGYKPISYSYESAYYFVEDVSVRLIVDKTFVLTGNNSICMNETATITATSELEDVHWTKLVDTVTVISPGKVLQVKPTINTTYRVSGKNCGLFVSDTITVFVNPLPTTALGADTTICKGVQLLLDAGAGHAEYHWSDGSQNRFNAVMNAGSYSVTVKNQFGCSAADVIKISTLSIPVVNLGRDTTLCEVFYQLNAGGNQDSYEWSTGSRDSVLMPTQVGTYWVTVANECGVAMDTITLHSYNRVSIPNVVTPNNDNLNDYLQVVLLDAEDNVLRDVPVGARIKILNRWGKEVFYSEVYKNNWPLTEDDISTGTFYYEVVPGSCRSYKGWVQVVR